MKISESQLREILRNIILEGRGVLGVESTLGDDDGGEAGDEYDDEYGRDSEFAGAGGILDPGYRDQVGEEDCEGAGQQKVVFASRSLFHSPSHHGWIILYDKNGKATTLSGKTGAAFTWDRVLKRFGLGRDSDADEAYHRVKQLWKDGELPEYEEWEDVLGAMQWRNLTKWENWNSDLPGNADYKVELELPDGMCMDEFQGRIRAGFDAYTDDLPYDPVPELSRNEQDRNSNSFAFSLARAGDNGRLPSPLKVSSGKWPGSGYRIYQIIQAGQSWQDEDRPVSRGTLRSSQSSPGSQTTNREDAWNRAGFRPGINELSSRNSLKNMILEVINEGDIVDLEKYRQSQQSDPDQEWFDLFDEEELQKYKTRGRLRRQTIEDPEREATEDETFEEYLQGIESGKVVDMFQDDDPMSEVKSDGAAYTGTLGTAQQVPTADDAGAAADKCQIDRDEIENVTNQYNTEEDQQQKKAYQDQLRVLTQNHNKSKSQGGCGP